MKFDFHNHLNKISDYPGDNGHFLAESSWGMALALNDRFKAMGLRPTIIVDLSLDTPVHVRLGDKLYGYYGEQSSDILSSEYDYVAPGDLLGHSERQGVLLSQLDSSRADATRLIDKATQKATQELSHKGVHKAPHDLFEGSLLRAHMQGFDINQIMYHETEADNVSGILDQGFNLDIIGSRGGDDHMPDGVFLKPNPHVINVASDPVQMAFLIRTDKQKVFENRTALCDFLKEDPTFFSAYAECQEVDEIYQEIVASFEKDRDKHERRSPEREEVQKLIQSTLDDWRVDECKAAAKARTRVTEIFNEAGFDSVKVANDLGSFNRMVETTIILNPENVQSIQHDFMPKKALEIERKDIDLSM